MNAAVRPPPLSPTELALEAAFLAVSLRLQLTPTQHRLCEERYHSLAAYVEREGSPLANRVLEVYPSGSFAILAVILGSVLRESHDFDVVLEIDIGTNADPASVIDALYQAIRGERGSRYYDMTRRNSRCVTVTYHDGVTLDLMPVARNHDSPPRAAVLFHHRPAEPGRGEERYRKPVNPWGFATFFNDQVPTDLAFAARVRRLREALSTRPPPSGLPSTDKAETQPVPPAVPLEEKPPRVMALQLMKRYRDKRHRRDDHRGMRKPPSVVLASLALDVGGPGRTLDEELLLLTRHLLRKLRTAIGAGRLHEVRNPSHPPDVFTDRWPASDGAQRLWLQDLLHMEARLVELRRELPFPMRLQAIFAELFGESVASIAVKGQMLEHRRARASGESGFEASGRVAAVTVGTAAGATVSRATAAPPSRTVDSVRAHDFYGNVRTW